MSLVRVQLPEPHLTTLRKKQFFEGFFQVKQALLSVSTQFDNIVFKNSRFLEFTELFIIFTAVISTIKNEILFLLCVRDNF